ncbi:hypothetical protein CKO25_20675 [Thiocapsa imhoffii]|uniref:Transposase IS204/IS1001/IS1096/IS1165 DDE domain-containing protein n=1 Tax=Thiocapsa imhoffii TaxID=382777 RepID=A0A9X1BAG8_9GAMM|nr:hypothetical protein [Thiocapsa imhoffii]
MFLNWFHIPLKSGRAITYYFVNRQTSGFVEGLNSKLKVLKRRCYGIANLAHLYQRVYLDLNGYARFGVESI